MLRAGGFRKQGPVTPQDGTWVSYGGDARIWLAVDLLAAAGGLAGALLLRLSPMVRLTRATFFSLALMLGVFAVWALSGFGYPSGALPATLNIVSKLLTFAVVLTLFFPPAAPGDTTAASAQA